jgi:hypothetical protein
VSSMTLKRRTTSSSRTRAPTSRRGLSDAFAAQPEASALAWTFFDVGDVCGPQEYGGATAQFDGRVDDICFIHDFDEPDEGGGAERV